MKIISILFIALFTSVIGFATPKKAEILVFSKTAGFRHGAIPSGVKALERMAEEKGFIATFTEDASVFNSKNLKNYKVIIFLNTTGDVFDANQKEAFTKYIQSGGGFVGIHAATDTEYSWPWYGKLIGAYFSDHPKIQNAKFIVTEPNHWSTKHMPAEFMHTDELYNFKNINPDVTTVLKVDENSYTGGKNGDFHPMSWYHNYDGGRVFYTALGHTNECYVDSLFLEHVWAGIKYAGDL